MHDHETKMLDAAWRELCDLHTELTSRQRLQQRVTKNIISQIDTILDKVEELLGVPLNE